jgi:hypothetical protein
VGGWPGASFSYLPEASTRRRDVNDVVYDAFFTPQTRTTESGEDGPGRHLAVREPSGKAKGSPLETREVLAGAVSFPSRPAPEAHLPRCGRLPHPLDLPSP